MRRTIVLFGILLCLLTGQAQQRGDSFLEFSAGGGWSTLTYSLNGTPDGLQASQAGSYGLNFHVGYGVMLHPYVGLGIGADISRFGATARLKGEMVWNDVTDTDGERYNHYTRINRWNDRQELYYVEVPLTIYFWFPTSSIVSVSAELGLKYAYQFLRNTVYEGNVTHMGQYPAWGMTVTDVPNHGFYSSDLTGKGHFDAQHQVTAFAKLGIMLPISPKLYFFSHLYAACGMRNAIGKIDAQQKLGFREDTDEAADMHYFMNPASSVLETNLPKGEFLPVSIGLEVGLRIRFAASTKRYPCRCLIDDEY